MKRPSPEPPATAATATPRPGGRPRRVAERTCVVCRARADKRGLVRIARLADGTVVVDETGKGPGRGAYLCHRRECWGARGLAARLGAALKTTLSGDGRARLSAFAAGLPADDGGV